MQKVVCKRFQQWLGRDHHYQKNQIDFISILFILIIKLKNIKKNLYIFPMETSKCLLFARTLWVFDMFFTN